MTTDLADGFHDLETETPREQRSLLGSWRPLALLWSGLIFVLGVVAMVLQVMGPPEAPSRPKPLAQATLPASSPTSQEQPAEKQPETSSPSAAPRTAMATASEPPASTGERSATPVLPPVSVVLPASLPSPRLPGSVAPPDPALLQPSKLYPGGQIPRIGTDRNVSFKAYASPFNAADPRPKVALLVAGFGMNEADSLAAVEALPAAVSIAVSPYSFKPDRLLATARERGHEYLLSLPMEPIGYPLNDPGDHALLTGASAATNAQQLEWSLTRFAGYVGATGALGDLRGERFGAAIDQMAPVLDRLADLGLLYVDPRPNGPHLSGTPAQRGVGRAVDVVIDDPPGREEIDRKLAALEQMARDHAGAIGLAGRPSPVTIGRIAAWAAALPSHGVTLAPVSAVVQMPRPVISTSAVAVRTNLFK